MDENLVSLKPNRPILGRYLETYIEQAHKEGHQLALLLIQIQRGQELTALLGYRAIDYMLEESAARITSACRKEDRIIRIGDLEFAMLLPDILNDGHAMLAANKVIGRLAQPYSLEAGTYSVESRIGIAMFPEHGAKADSLVQYAESALADAKASGAPYAVYTDRAMGRIEEAWDIESEIEAGLHEGEFEVYYQPKIDLRNRMLCGAEALVRWRNRKRGLVSPNEFIPVAAKTGQLKSLTWSVLNMALGHLAAWPTELGHLSVSVNIAPELLEDELVTRVTDAMGIWGTKPDTLILELTESGVMSQPEQGFDILRHLRQKGVGVSIDDFGTGYSSLANFRHMPATELKIDKSFVTDMLVNELDFRIVRSIIALAKSFELTVAAEGAENLSTLGKLANSGCDYAQGYCISPPMPADIFSEFIAGYTPIVY